MFSHLFTFTNVMYACQRRERERERERREREREERERERERERVSQIERSHPGHLVSKCGNISGVG